MNKRIITLSVVGILGLMGLSGCSEDVTKLQVKGEDVIVTIGKGDNAEHYTANELFGNYLNTSSGASSAFSAIYDVLVGKAVETSQEITSSVNAEVTTLQENATTNASNNGTTYNEELSNLLESEGVEDLDEFIEKKELQYKKEHFEEEFYDNQFYSKNMSETEVEADKYQLQREYIENDNPYHVRHILVKVSASGSSFFPTAETISSTQAQNLANVIKNLASPSMTFGNVAEFYSEDGSASSLGSLNQLMDEQTQYVNEFKFAVFQYDAYFNKNVAAKEAARLNIPVEADTGLNTEAIVKGALNRIPYSVAEQLLEYADTIKLPNGENYKDGKDYYYPRNVLFNHYFSNHGLSVITRGNAILPEGSHFAHIDGLSASTNTADDVLVDENGRPVLVTRAGTGSSDSGYQGIHFIVIENSPLVNESKVGTAGYQYSLDEELRYYSTNIPKTGASVENDKRYVTFINADRESYGDRVSDIETAVKGYDSNIKFRLYEEVVNQLKENGVTITIDSRIETSVNNYINFTKAKAELTKEETYENFWKTYVRQLQTQKDFEGYKIPLSEIDNFTK